MEKEERYNTILGRYLRRNGLTFRKFCMLFKFRLNTIYAINKGAIPYRDLAAKIYIATHGEVDFKNMERNYDT